MSCPYGIVLGADTRIPRFAFNTGRIVGFSSDPKTYAFTSVPVAASYWGLAEIKGKSMIMLLSDFDKKHLSCNDDVNSIANKLELYLRELAPEVKHRVGIHIAGYCKGEEGMYPQIRHLFHMDYHKPGEFTNENSNIEIHTIKNGEKTTFGYNPYVSVFNGDFRFAHTLFNLLPHVLRNTKQLVIPDKLSLEQSVELVTLIIDSSSKILDFLSKLASDEVKVHKTIKGLTVATITKMEGFRWVTPFQDGTSAEWLPVNT